MKNRRKVIMRFWICGERIKNYLTAEGAKIRREFG